MRIKIKKIMKALCFLLGLLIILAVSSMIIRPNGNVYNSSAVESKTKSYQLEKENSVDVIFLGDSETYANFSPLHIWNETGITSYVMGISAQRLCDTYELLKRSVENQDIKLVLLETNCLYRDSSTYNSDSDDYVMDKASDIFPVLKYHSRWKEYLPGNLSTEHSMEERNYKGFRLRFEAESYTAGEWMHKTDMVEEIAANNIDYLVKIKNFCDERNIEFALVSAPSPDCWTYERHNAVSQWACDNSVDFLDLNLIADELDINWATDTRDAGNHVNYYGAEKVSGYLSVYLKENYELTDHRNDSYYEEWNNKYEDYYNKIMLHHNN